MKSIKLLYDEEGKVATAKYDTRYGLLIPTVVNTYGIPVIAYSVVTKEELAAMLDDVAKFREEIES